MAIYRGPGGPGDATADAANTSALAAQYAADAEADANAAANSAAAAAGSESAAQLAELYALIYSYAAENYKNDAESHANAAYASELNAAASAINAAADAASIVGSVTGSAASAAAALVSETNAAASEANAATSEANAATSETNAAASAAAALTSETNAATSETNAAASATAAATSETNAATSETNAAASATTASTAASNAATSEANAATSASNAATSETNAAASETAAAGSATAAATSATNAATSESNAATSETNAAASASAAATSESNASTSASAASTSASNAATSATASATSATNAATSETNAAASASSASTSASNAATSETNAAASASSASTSASNAATSETNAAASESAAAASESNAATSETNAAASATAALAAQTQTESIFDQFGDQYLGAHASDPSLDNDGDPLNSGDIYWNTTNNTLRFYNGTAWVAPETIATTAATNAATSATNAATSEANAATSETNAATSETNAAASATAAATSASDAALSESNAANSETAASGWASAASTSASNAAASEAAAALSETNAATSEANAATSESNAATSETNAAASASAAATSASNAATSETNAASSETAAGVSASAAATSATNAATSETNAATSETNAAASASAASTSASNAATSETNASTSETNAAASALAASTSETNAATSETNAATSALAASTSESNALTSATNAATSETNAATSAFNAATSETNAAASASAAANSFDAFDDRYLGDKASDPAVDNDGDPLITGAIYFNTTNSQLRVFDGTNWIDAVSTSGPGGVIDVAHGGTDRNTLTLNHLLAGDGVNPVKLIAPGSNGQVLMSNGTEWSAQTFTAPAGTSINGVTGSLQLLGRGGVHQAYQGEGSGWSSDFTVSRAAGAFCRSPVGGGHNMTDSPNQWYRNKNGDTFSSAQGQMPGLPYDAHDQKGWYKRFYWNSTRNSWSQREDIHRAETLGNGSRDVIGHGAIRFGGDNYADIGTFYRSGNAYTNLSVSVTGTYLDPGTTLSTSVNPGMRIYFAFNGQRGRVTIRDNNNTNVNETRDVDSYNGNYWSWENLTGGVVTLYYSYWLQGDDPERTFIKIWNSTPNTTFVTGTLYDRGGCPWQYYWENQRIFNEELNNAAGGWEFYDRRQRIFTTQATTIPISGSGGFTAWCQVNINNPLLTTQSICILGTSADGFTVTCNTAANQRRLFLTINQASVAVVSNLPIWQFDGDGAEDFKFHYTWNALETTAPGRFYVNGCLVWQGTTNYMTSTQMNVGSTANGTANGFTGSFTGMGIIPEVMGTYQPTGTFNMNLDRTVGLVNTNNNGNYDVVASMDSNGPRLSYLRDGTTYTYGSYFENQLPSSDAAGSYTLTCNSTAGTNMMYAGNATSGWSNPSGFFLVTGGNVPTTNNVYASINFGDKEWGISDAEGNNVFATNGNGLSFTFKRVNGGPFGWGSTGLLHIMGNTPTSAKSTATGRILTNLISGQSTLTNAAFPNFTITMVAGTVGDETSTGNTSIRTATTQDAAVRNLQGMLAIGKKPTITGTGIPAVSAAINNTYVDDVWWDYYARGAHRIWISNATTANPTASAYTLTYVPGPRSTLHDNLDRTGGDWSSVESYDLSPLVQGNGGDSVNSYAIEYTNGLVKKVRAAPPKAYFDSGLFRATSATYTRNMYINFAHLLLVCNYGSVPYLNFSTTNPNTTVSTSVGANGISVATTSGNYYRIFILPIKSITEMV